MTTPLMLKEQSRTGVTLLTLNRPEKRNALSSELMRQLCEAVEQVEADPAQRVLVLRGAGPVFCAGLDLAEAREAAGAEHAARLVAHTLRSLSQSRLVTVAAVQGAALAGGAGIMAACDLAVAAEDAAFGFPEVQRGLVPALIMHFLLRQLPDRHARELLLLGETITARRALELGLVNRLAAPQRVLEEALALTVPLLAAGPQAVERTKRLMADLAPRALDDDLHHALRQHLDARQSAEAAEGLAAFFEKRAPRWPVPTPQEEKP